MGVRVGVQEPSPLLREGLRLRLGRETDLEVAAAVARLGELDDRLFLDVLVIDVAQQELAGLCPEIAQLRARRPALRVVGVHDGLGRSALDLVRSAGVDAVVDRELGVDALLAAVREPSRVTRERWVRPSVGPVPLDRREAQVLELLAAGRTTQEIAAALEVPARIVAATKHQVFVKLDVQTQSHAVAEALRLGLLALPAGVVG